MGTEPSECPRAHLEHRTVRAVDRDSEPLQGHAEALTDERDIALRAVMDFLRLGCGRFRARVAGSTQRLLDRLLLVVLELPAAAKEFHAVVLRRIVGGRDDGTGLLCEERNGRRREYPTANRARPTGGKARFDGALEFRAGSAGVPPDEHGLATAPAGVGGAEALDERGGQLLTDHPPDPVGPEVLPRQGLALRELRRLARLVQTGRLALDNARVAREEALALEDGAELGIGLDERPRNAVTERAGLTGRTAAVETCAEVELALHTGDAERRGCERPQHLPREVLLDRPPVDPGRPVAWAQNDARHRGLPLAGALVLRDLAHDSGRGCGFWALCGCSGPAYTLSFVSCWRARRL